MAKHPMKVMCSPVTNAIYVGRVDEAKGLFVGEKDDVTKSAVMAVASHLIQSNEAIQFECSGKTYIMRVDEQQEPRHE